MAEPVAGRIVGRRINEDGHRDDYNEGLEHIQRYEVNENPQKTNCLTTVQKDNMIAEPIGAVGNMYGKGQNGQLYGLNSKTKTLSAGTGQTGNGIGSNNSPKAILPYPEYNGNPIYEVKDGHITIKGKSYPIKLADGFYVIRKLTVSECKRLQTVPEDYDMSVISNTQAYKCLGNGWTVDVIAHLVEGVMKELEE